MIDISESLCEGGLKSTVSASTSATASTTLSTLDKKIIHSPYDRSALMTIVDHAKHAANNVKKEQPVPEGQAVPQGNVVGGQDFAAKDLRRN